MTEYRVYHFTIVEDPDYEVVTHYVEAFRKDADVLRFIKENKAEAIFSASANEADLKYSVCLMNVSINAASSLRGRNSSVHTIPPGKASKTIASLLQIGKDTAACSNSVLPIMWDGQTDLKLVVMPPTQNMHKG